MWKKNRKEKEKVWKERDYSKKREERREKREQMEQFNLPAEIERERDNFLKLIISSHSCCKGYFYLLFPCQQSEITWCHPI